MKKLSHITYRIAPNFWLHADRFSALLETLQKNRQGFDDVALFCGDTHSVRKLSVVREEMPILKNALAQLRAVGIPAGINLLCLMGHHTENIAAIPTELQPLVGYTGNTCLGTVCPRTPENREKYLIPLLQMLAACEPDYLWLDDDIRFFGHGDLRFVCCCEHCLAAFNQQWGSAFTRRELVQVCNRGTSEERKRWRLRWLEFSGQSIIELFRLVEQTVHAVHSGIELGAMDAGMRVGDSASMTALVAALSGSSSRPVRWRPGAGAYTDARMDAFFEKAQLLGCEAAHLPDTVENIQAEVENFNYQRLAKSKKANVLEASLYVSAGLTGCAWNVMAAEDPLSVYQPLLHSLTASRKYLDQQAAYARIRPVGVYHGWTSRQSAGIGLETENGDWETSLGSWENPHFSGLFTGGLPPAYRLQEAVVTILTPASAWVLTEEELTAIFSRGVYCPAEVLRVLEQRGLADLTGFRIVGMTPYDAVEVLREHPLHGNSAGFRRDCRQSFPWGHENAYHLESLNGQGQDLAQLCDYNGKILADCSLGVTTNALGGRVAVGGYYPLRDLQFYHKIQTMKALFCYLASDRLPAYVASFHRVALWVRLLPAGGMVVQMTNLSSDLAEHVQIQVNRNYAHGVLLDDSCARREVHGVAASEVETASCWELSELRPWESAMLVLE